jgi:bromodomain-containing factor 1
MVDVASHPPKQTREREDDTEDLERAAKRFKTDEPLKGSEEPDFKMPEIPAASVSGASSPQVANGESAAFNGLTDGDDTVTPARLAHMKKVISNLKKSNASAAFRLPVDYMALKIPSYPEIVKEPMDLQTIDQRLKQNQYRSVATFVRDFELIVHNCITFNGPDHGVSQAARKMQSSFRGQMRNLPKANDEEPSKETKKAARKHEPTRQAPPRRPSVTAPNNTITVQPASSPKTVAPATPSFAPGPDGMPLIRRDSTLADGRPKRAIVPTKRNQEFGGGRPKKKKYELQLKFCDEVLKEIASPKHWQLNQYFTHPVDPVALNIPTYFQIIKKPMDLATVRTKLTNNVYEKARDFEEDVRLIFKNCYKFNPDGDLVHTSGRQLEDLFNEKWATKDEWIAAREPPSEPQSDADEDDEEEDVESEDEADDSEEDRNDKIKMLQKQIEEMSKQMGELTQKKSKKSKSKSPPTKKKAKAAKKEKPAAGTPNLGKEKKERKKAAPRARPEKDRYVTFAEKQYISNGIAMLPEKQMQEALKIIQNSVPSLANSDQNEIELDIEEVPNHALLKLLNFVKRYAGPPPDEPKAEPADVYAPAATKSKKSKPMSKHEQEAQIEELKGRLGAYGGPGSPNAVPSIEAGDSSDDDDGDSEESEEE